MSKKYNLEEIKQIAQKLDEKMDFSQFHRIPGTLPGIYLELDKFDLLNVPVDQTKIGKKITTNEISDTNMCIWINGILEIYPMNINGEITFLMTDDMIKKTFLFKIANTKDLAKLIYLFPEYTTGHDCGIQRIYKTATTLNFISNYKIYPMNYFMTLYNQFNFLLSETNSCISLRYANYDIVMSRIKDHKEKMQVVWNHLTCKYFFYTDVERGCYDRDPNYKRIATPYLSYSYPNYKRIATPYLSYSFGGITYYHLKHLEQFKKWMSSKDSYLTILEKKPKNLHQIWNTRYLELIDF